MNFLRRIQMKPLISAAVLVMAASSFSLAQEEKEIMELEDGWFQARIRNDIATFTQLLAEDFFVTSSSGKARVLGNKWGKRKDGTGRDVNIGASGDRFVAFNLEDRRVRVYGDAAVSTGLQSFKLETKEGKIRDVIHRYTRLYVKQKGRWKMVAAQATRPKKR